MEENPNNLVIKINNFYKSFGPTVKAVNGLNLEIKSGEIYGLLGPNGAGKSTTIKALLGFLTIDQGELNVLGLNPLQEPEQIKALIGYSPEDFSLYESMTAKELFEFVASIRGLDYIRVSERLNFLLHELRATEYIDALIGSLSRGNKQKRQLISALLHSPKLLILDEPLSGLDARGAFAFKNILQQHVKEGGSVLLSTHVMEQAQNLCDRIGIIVQGSLVTEGTFEELKSQASDKDASLEKIFLELTEVQ